MPRRIQPRDDIIRIITLRINPVVMSISIVPRMRSRRVPVLKLGSRGPAGDARSLRCVRKAFASPQSVRKRSQAFASVRNRSRRVGHAGESTEFKIVAKRRTVVTFYVSHFKSANSHRDRGSRGRETQNCRHFWARLASTRLKSVNSHRDRGGRGRETQNCRHFWTRLASPCLKSANSHRDRGCRGRETQNCRHFWTRLASPRLKSVNSVSKVSTVTEIGGVVSRSPELSSLLDSSCVSASQKCQQLQGSGGVVVAKPRTVVTFGLASRERKGERRE